MKIKLPLSIFRYFLIKKKIFHLRKEKIADRDVNINRYEISMAYPYTHTYLCLLFYIFYIW